MINLLIAEDQEMLLTTLASLLNLEDDINVVHQSKNGQNALNFLTDDSNVNIDILLTDIEMPKLTGIELVQEIKKRGLKTKTIV